MEREQELKQVASVSGTKMTIESPITFIDIPSYELGFIAGAQWETDRDKWKPISELSKDIPITVIRWHKQWKCTISVWYNKHEDGNLHWYEQTLTTRWPEEAFEPFYMELPPAPKTQ